MGDTVVDASRVCAVAAALDNPVRVELLRELLRGAAYPGELSTALGVSPQRMTKHIAALQRGGLVEAVAEGRRVRVAVAGPEVRALLETMSRMRETLRPARCPGTMRGVRL